MTSQLLAAMAERFPQDDWRVLLPGGRGEVPAGTTPRRTRVPGRPLFAMAASAGRPRLDALLGGVDVAWLPAPAPAAISRNVPSVLTLHDLSWVQRPRDFTLYERAWHLVARLRAQAERATWIVAVSEHTRQIALELWGLEPARVVVVEPPIASCSVPAPRHDASGDPYFLWVGALEPRKAPDVLELAWRTARARGLEARLVVVGDGRVPLSGPGVQRRGWVSDAELGTLYDGALALVMPSRLEGAGLPPLEAALHGTPSICSDLAVLRESLGPGGAEWVPVEDAGALADALLRVARDAERRQRVAAAAGRSARIRTDPGPAADRLRALLADASATSGMSSRPSR